jgi:hypothetical protein
MSVGHLGPDETGEFASHGGSDDSAAILARRESAEPTAQADLRGPRPLEDLGVEAFVAALELGANARRELIGPSGTDKDGANVADAGLGDGPAPLGGAGGVLGPGRQRP